MDHLRLRGVAVLFAAAFGCAIAAGKEPLLIGQTADFSGPQASPVKETTDAARAYFDWVNKQGGVNGRPIVLESVDDGFDPKKTLENANRLAATRPILAMMLSRGTANAEALIPFTREKKILVLAPVGGSEKMHRPADHYLFNIRPTHRSEAERAVAQLSAQGLARIAVAYVDDAMGNDAMKGALAGLKTASLQPAALVTIPRGEPKVEAAVDALVKAQPDAIVGLCIAKSCAALVKQLRAKGLYSQFVSMSNTSSAGYVRDLGPAARGVIVTQVYPYPFSDATKASRDFRILAREYKLASSYSAMEGFIAAKVMTEALKRSGPNPTREGMIRAMESLDRFDVGGFVVNFGNHSRSGSELMEMTMIGKDGKFVR